MLTFFLSTNIGRLILGILIASGLALGTFVYGDAHGRRIAHAADAAKLTACVDANSSDQAAITQLKAANMALAASVRASKASEAQAKADVATATQRAQNAADAARKAINETYRKHPAAAAWARQPIPAGVIAGLH